VDRCFVLKSQIPLGGFPHALRLTENSLWGYMAYDWLKGVSDEYDVIVIGSG